MSRSRQRVEALGQIAGIRAISARLAEAKYATAIQSVVVAQDKQKKQQDHLHDAVGGWEDAMSALRFDPENSIFWGHAVNQAVLNVKVAASDVDHCGAIVKQTKAHMARMIANERCAETLLTKARKKYLDDTEKQQLAEQADQITRLEMRR